MCHVGLHARVNPVQVFDRHQFSVPRSAIYSWNRVRSHCRTLGTRMPCCLTSAIFPYLPQNLANVTHTHHHEANIGMPDKVRNWAHQPAWIVPVRL